MCNVHLITSDMNPCWKAQPPREAAPQYRGTWLTKTAPPPGPYSRTMPRVLCWPLGGGMFLMSEVHLCIESARATSELCTKFA